MVKLLDQVRVAIRVCHYSIRTEQAYVDWAQHYILFYGKRATPPTWMLKVLAIRVSAFLRRFL